MHINDVYHEMCLVLSEVKKRRGMPICFSVHTHTHTHTQIYKKPCVVRSHFKYGKQQQKARGTVDLAAGRRGHNNGGSQYEDTAAEHAAQHRAVARQTCKRNYIYTLVHLRKHLRKGKRCAERDVCVSVCVWGGGGVVRGHWTRSREVGGRSWAFGVCGSAV